MNLAKSTDELLDEICRIVYEKLYGTGALGLYPYLHALSAELTVRKVQHETSQKCLDKHKEKYFQIDVLIPSWDRFVMLKHRKHITRADMIQFRQQEGSVGMKGLLVNFYNGVDVRESTSLLPGDEKRELAKQKGRLRGALGVHHAASLDRLPGIDDLRYHGPRSWGGPSAIVGGPSSTILPATPAATVVDYEKIFAASCASYFISEGDRSTFASAFNDFLTQMSIKRLTFPRRHLHELPLQKPEGVLNENLDHFFKSLSIASSLRKKSPDSDSNHSRSESITSETRKSVTPSSPPPHLQASQDDIKTLSNYSLNEYNHFD